MIPTGTYFEDYAVGQRWRHARGSSIGEIENQLLSKLVMNTAQEHWNDHSMAGSPWGESRIVFGLLTVSVMVGLASQDASENALQEMSLTRCRLHKPVFHGDVIYAATEVLGTESVADRTDAGLVNFQHWAFASDGSVVAECVRGVLVRRREQS